MKEKNSTIKYFWLYRAFSYDLLFYYTVAALYYTQIKGFNNEQFMFLGAFVAFSSFLMLPFASMVIKKYGATVGVRLGSFFWIIYLLGIIIFKNLYLLFFMELFCSFGTCLKVLSDSQLIVNTLRVNNREQEYLKCESKGISTYFIFDCICALLAGLLYEISAYLPMLMCLLAIIFMFILSFKIKDESYELHKLENITNNTETTKTKLPKEFFIFLFFVFSLYSLIMSVVDLKELGLIELGFGAIGISLIAFISKIINFLSSKFYGKFGEKSSSSFIVCLCTMLLVFVFIIGISYITLSNTIFKIIIIVIALLGLECIKQPYKLYSKNQLRKISKTADSNKLYTIYFMCEMAADCLLSVLGGVILIGGSIGLSYLVLLATTISPIIFSVYLMNKIKD